MSKSLYKSEYNEMWTSDRATPYPCVSPLNHNFKDLQEYKEGVDYRIENTHRQVIVNGHLEWVTQLTAIPIKRTDKPVVLCKNEDIFNNIADIVRPS